jgi:hypothetical protein
MVGLARVIYNPRPGELTGALRDPAELCSPALANQTAVEFLLFDAFIPAAYRNNPAARWKASEAEKWLVFLARHLEHNLYSTSLGWWKLPRHRVFRVAPSRGMRFSVGDFIAAAFWSGFVGAITIGLLSGITAGIRDGLTKGFVVGLKAGLGFWLLNGLAYGIWQAMKSTPSNLAAATSPREVFARDRRTAVLVCLGLGAVAGLVGGIADFVWPSLRSPHGSLWLSVIFWIRSVS